MQIYITAEYYSPVYIQPVPDIQGSIEAGRAVYQGVSIYIQLQ